MSYRRYIVNHTRQTASLLIKSLGAECYQYNNSLFDEFLNDSFHGDNIELLKEDEYPPTEYFVYKPTPAPTSHSDPSPE